MLWYHLKTFFYINMLKIRFKIFKLLKFSKLFDIIIRDTLENLLISIFNNMIYVLYSGIPSILSWRWLGIYCPCFILHCNNTLTRIHFQCSRYNLDNFLLKLEKKVKMFKNKIYCVDFLSLPKKCN